MNLRLEPEVEGRTSSTCLSFKVPRSYWAKPKIPEICFCRPVDRVTGALSGFRVSREDPKLDLHGGEFPIGEDLNLN